MATRTYERLWREAEEEIGRVVEDDKAYVVEDVIEDRPRAFRQAATNYIRYSMCVNKLNVCLDQIIHVQKRMTVRKLLEATTGRLLQVKQELVNMELSDFNYLDGVLIDMRLTPYDVEIQVPRHYRRESAERVMKVNQDIDRIIEDLAKTPPPEEETGEEVEDAENKEGAENTTDKKEHKEEAPAIDTTAKNKAAANPNWPPQFKKVELTESQKMFKSMILLVQRHERARVARKLVQELKEKKRIQHDVAWHTYKPIPEETLEWAVSLIQRFWREYASRHLQWHRRTQGRLLMGELTPSWRSHDQEDCTKVVEQERHDKQKIADEEYARAKDELQTKIRHQEEDMKDDIGDHLRWYIEDWYRTVGELPQFPEPVKISEPEELLGFPEGTPPDFFKRHVHMIPAAKLVCAGLPPQMLGGSALVVAGYWVSPELYELAHTAARLAKGKAGAKGAKKEEKLTKQQLKQKMEEEKEKKLLEEEAKQKLHEEKLKRGVVPNPTELLDPLCRDLDKSKAQWGRYDDLEWNPDQKHREDLPKVSMAYDQHDQLREVVDELMRLELIQLQAALDRDRGKKKKGGDKKKKKKKPKEKKPKKDLTHDRTPESLFTELVQKGIIKKSSMGASIDSFFCEPSWNNYDLRRDPWWQSPLPNLWDVKQVVKEYCILPLGSATVHSVAPFMPSVLLTGYPDCGKRTLVDAVVAETGAVLFDLSAANVVGKYPGRQGLRMLVHLVTKVAKQVQPSVIFIDGGEKPFYKKVPKAEKQDNPRLLKTQLPKMVKGLTAQDQVLFLATAETPWAAAAKSVKNTYKKIIPVLPPDRGTATSYWHSLLMKYHGVNRDFLLSPLTWCAQGYPLPTIEKVVRTVLTAERIVALKYRPLQPREFQEELLKIEPLGEEQVKKLMDWYEGTYPLAQTKAVKMKEETELREKLAAIEAKKNEKSKKKKK